MGQITTGARRILSVPFFYDLFQDLVGASGIRERWIRDFLRPFPGARILDIGCGTAGILPYLPGYVDYTGFDLSPAYIEAARARHGMRGRFSCARAEVFEPRADEARPYDIAMAFGVLHHLDDAEARSLLRNARSALGEGGRLVTLDPAFVPDQGRLARFAVSRDRGRNVRYPEAYAALGGGVFSRIETTVLRGALRIPYDHAALVFRP
jgi:SAM-dependent methyltransferase